MDYFSTFLRPIATRHSTIQCHAFCHMLCVTAASRFQSSISYIQLQAYRVFIGARQICQFLLLLTAATRYERRGQRRGEGQAAAKAQT